MTLIQKTGTMMCSITKSHTVVTEPLVLEDSMNKEVRPCPGLHQEDSDKSGHYCKPVMDLLMIIGTF